MKTFQSDMQEDVTLTPHPSREDKKTVAWGQKLMQEAGEDIWQAYGTPAPLKAPASPPVAWNDPQKIILHHIYINYIEFIKSLDDALPLSEGKVH